jgi:hypothetical protein
MTYTPTPEELAIIHAKLDAQTQQEKLEKFVKTRVELIAKNIVTVSTGKRFDADEASMNRLCNAKVKHLGKSDDYIVKWSTADVGTGVMIDCTYAEIVEAHGLATDYFGQVWNVNNESSS